MSANPYTPAWWSKEASNLLVGRTITDAFYDKEGLLLTLDDGTYMYPMRDDEGNGPGAIHWHNDTKALKGTLPAVIYPGVTG